MRVMVVGASADHSKYGNKAVRAYLRGGHTVLPVHPSQPQIEGLDAWSSVADVPGPIDRATFYVPPAVGIGLLPALAQRGDVGELWLNPGAESPELIAEAARLGLPTTAACSIIDIGQRPD